MREARGSVEALNLLALSGEAVRNPVLGANVVADWDQEKAGTADWTAINGAILSKQAGAPSGSGSQVLRDTYNGVADPIARQAGIFAANNLYEIEAWCQGSAGGFGNVLIGGSRLNYSKNSNWGKWRAWHRPVILSNLDLSAYGAAGAWEEWDNVICRIYTAAAIAGLSVTHAAIEYALIASLGIVPIAYHGPCHSDDGIRVHHASSQVSRYSCTAMNNQWSLGNVTMELGQSQALAQPLSLFLETNANSTHAVNASTLLVASVGSHVLTFYAAPSGRTSVLVRIALAAGNVDTVVSLSAGLARYPISFTAGAGDVGVAKLVTFYMNGTTVPYVGDPTKGAYIDMVQVEPGDVPTPYMRSYGSVVSGIAPVYDLSATTSKVVERMFWRLGGAALEPEIQLKWLYDLPAAVTDAPLWTLKNSHDDTLELIWQPQARPTQFRFKRVAGGTFIVDLPTTWAPVAGHVYDFRVHYALDGAGTYDLRLKIIDRTANTVEELSTTTATVLWKLSSVYPSDPPVHWYLGADRLLANQWDFAIQEVRA